MKARQLCNTCGPPQTVLLTGLMLLAGGLISVSPSFPVSLHAFEPETVLAGTRFQDSVPALHVAVRLLTAALIGSLIGSIQRRTRHEQPLSRSMVQAHALLCVAGALTMIIIGDSLARAFGVAGAASIIRFRTPVEDPRDITVLFLLMALGMAAGLSLFTVAGLGTLFLVVGLILMDRANASAPRSLKVALVARGRTFPTAHVEKVFADRDVTIAPLEIFYGDSATVRYRAAIGAQVSIEQLSADLLGGAEDPNGLTSVSWETSKKGS